jgi:hypothetical protein
MNLDECLARACEPVPGLMRGALALLPEGLLISGVGEGSIFEHEPLARSAARCLTAAIPGKTRVDPFVEHVFVSPHELVVIVRGQRYPQLALALACRNGPNLTFVLSLSRMALHSIEATTDLAVWEL